MMLITAMHRKWYEAGVGVLNARAFDYYPRYEAFFYIGMKSSIIA